MQKLFILLFLSPLMLFGQRPMQMGGKAMERLESYKKVRMLETLNLDEEKAMKLVSRYNAHRERIHELETERIEVIDVLEKMVGSNPSDAEYQKTFTSLMEIEKRMAEARGKFLNDLKDILTSRQIAEYLVFERNFARDIRDVIRDVQKERQKRKP